MPFTLTMPKLSPTMDQGTLVKWHKKEGDFVNSGDLLFEVATDKATVEHNALDEGWLRKILVKENEDAVINQPVAIFTEGKDESIEGYEPQGTAKATAQPASTESTKEGAEDKNEGEATPQKGVPKPPAGAMSQPIFAPEAPLENYTYQFPSEAISARIKASPLAKKLAKEQNLDLSTVKGSGPGGRIVSRDLKLAQPKSQYKSTLAVPTLPPGSFEEETLTPMRKVIAQRLQEAKTFIPHFYVTQTIDAQAMVDLRAQLEKLEIKVSFNDLVVRATALTLKRHPIVNSGFNTSNNTITRYKTVDVSVAVSLPEGLITPVIHHADFKSIGELSVEIKSLVKKARDGKLQPQEYKGGSFTVSNLGMYGVTEFQAIINPPQSGILAVSGILDVPVIKNGQVVPGKTMNVTLSVDHRVVDGVAAAEFLKTLKFLLENPASLLI